MAYVKNILLVGETVKVKEFQQSLRRAGAAVTLVGDTTAALAAARQDRPDGIVFVVPVYWESVADFVAAIRREPTLAAVPIVYLGDFIEANDQLILKRQGVHTLTLGPVPPAEAVRYILKVI